MTPSFPEKARSIAWTVAGALLFLACAASPEAPGHGHGAAGAHAHDHDHDRDDTRPTNRVAVPQAVRDSLGIRFARAEERQVTERLRLACRGVPSPGAHRPYVTPLAGTVTLRVAPQDVVVEGQLLATLVSPELLEHRHELHLAADAVGEAADAVEVAAARVAQARGDLAFVRARLKRLQDAGTSRASLEASRRALEGELAVLKAEHAAARRARTRAEHRFEAELASHATRLGVPVEALKAFDDAEAAGDRGDGGGSSADHGDEEPGWERLSALELRAAGPGVVTDVPAETGAWLGRGDVAVTVVDPTRVEVACRALASDLTRLATGQTAAVVPSARAAARHEAELTGRLRVGVEVDPARSTVPVRIVLDGPPGWLRPGLTAFADVAVGGTAQPEVAVPTAALVRDGLETVLFRRDPADPDQVIRTPADHGPSDGEWTVLFAGVAPGDEVVVEGAYELKLASGSAPSPSGHFHADGTFHEGHD